MLVAGARPNFMKVGPLYRQLSRHRGVKPFFVHTGQHYDYNMSESFLQDLGLPKPDAFLDAGSGSHAEQTARTMVAFEKICLQTKPNLVVVVGDVNSTMACAVTAKKLLIPVAHVEAGLRSRDMTMPEEINRLVTDAVSDYLFTPSRDADENLKQEGATTSKIYFVGNIMIDSLKAALPKARQKNALADFGFQPKGYGLITLHRPSNVDLNEKLGGIVKALLKISLKIPLIFPIHPRTLKNLHNRRLAEGLKSHPRLKITQPLGYIDFINLMMNTCFVLTDSGGIQEETTFLGVPCLTLRDNTERPITLTQGTNELVKLPDLTEKVRLILDGKWKHGKIPKYWDGKTAQRIAAVIRKI